MRRPSHALIVAVSLSSAVAFSALAEQLGTSRPGILDMQYRDSRLSATIEKARLEDLAWELERVTGAKVSFAREELGDVRLSATVRSLLLDEALVEIFRGFSYASAQHPETGQLLLRITASNAGTAPATVASVDASPRDLDEFQSLEALETAAVPEAFDPLFEQDEELQQVIALEAEEATRDLEAARVERALAVLESDHRALWNDAIGALVGKDDRRATEALARAATDFAEDDADTRFYAAESLINHAADLKSRIGRQSPRSGG